MEDYTSEHMPSNPVFHACKMTSRGEMVVAIAFKNGFILGRMWLDIVDIPAGTTPAQINSGRFRAKVWSNVERCCWIPRDQFDDNFDRHILGARPALPKPDQSRRVCT